MTFQTLYYDSFEHYYTLRCAMFLYVRIYILDISQTSVGNSHHNLKGAIRVTAVGEAYRWGGTPLDSGPFSLNPQCRSDGRRVRSHRDREKNRTSKCNVPILISEFHFQVRGCDWFCVVLLCHICVVFEAAWMGRTGLF